MAIHYGILRRVQEVLWPSYHSYLLGSWDSLYTCTNLTYMQYSYPRITQLRRTQHRQMLCDLYLNT